MANTNELSTSVSVADELLSKTKKVGKGSTLAESGIKPVWMMCYAEIAERADRSHRYGFSRYPYEADPAVNVFVGDLLDHPRTGPSARVWRSRPPYVPLQSIGRSMSTPLDIGGRFMRRPSKCDRST